MGFAATSWVCLGLCRIAYSVQRGAYREIGFELGLFFLVVRGWYLFVIVCCCRGCGVFLVFVIGFVLRGKVEVGGW